ncbi:MAG: ornithine decarboxylase, partial [Nocardioidaceae bacterium]|nr:ornithine decarboxylase [Nocardioidaceae bacterium]
DEPGAIQLLSDVAPGASVLCRIGTPATPGCSPEQAVGVLRESARRGLDPAGVSFHLGSGQGDPSAWDAPVGRSARVLTRLRADGFAPWLLDLGGGLPAHLDGSAYPLASYGAAIERSLRRHFPQDRPATIVEPGRAVVADAR